MPRAFVLVLLILCARLHSQVPGVSQQSYTVNVQQFSVKEGLDHRRVDAVSRDKDGFLWITTRNNLQRYDGYEFKSYSLTAMKRKETMETVMGQDEEGWIWLLTEDRRSRTRDLFFLDPLTGEFISKEGRLGDALAAELNSLANIDDYPAFNQPGAIGQLYFGGKRQIVLFDFKKGVRKINLPIADLTPAHISLIDTQGNFWTGNRKAGLIRKISREGKALDSIRVDTLVPHFGAFLSYYFDNNVFEWEGAIYIRDVVKEAGLGQSHIYRYDPSGKHQLAFKVPDGYVFGGLLEGQFWCFGKSGWTVFDRSGALVHELKREDYQLQLSEGIFNSVKFEVGGSGEYFLRSSMGLSVINMAAASGSRLPTSSPRCWAAG